MAGPHSFAGVDAGRRVVSLPGQPGAGYLLSGKGNLTPYGGAPAAHPSATWSWDIARDAIVLPNGTGGYVLDGYGGFHPFAIGSNPQPPAASGSPYWPGRDIAHAVVVLPNGTGGYVLDGYGGIHPFAIGSNPKPPATSGSPYWNGWDIARGLVLNPSGTGGYVLDGYGGLHPFAIGSNAKPPAVHNYPYWPGWDVVGSVTASKAPGEPLKLATLDSHGGLGFSSP